MTLQDYERLMDVQIPLDEDTRFAIQYLEERGSRFCVDFGYENAKDRAAELASARVKSCLDPDMD
jgi:hypothetical protein